MIRFEIKFETQMGTFSYQILSDITKYYHGYVFELSLSSNEDGYIEYINTIPLSYQISAPSYNLGDINADETINVLDIVILVNIIIGTQSPSEMEQLSADMNEDGMINVQDIVLLVNSVIN